MASVSRAVFVLLVSLALCQAVAGLASEQEPKPVDRIQAPIKKISELSYIQRVAIFIRELHWIERVSQELQEKIGNITKSTAHEDGRFIALGLGGNNGELNSIISVLGGCERNVTLPVAKRVVRAIDFFVKAQIPLLQTVRGKHSLGELKLFTESIRCQLNRLNELVNSLEKTLSCLLPKEEFERARELLDSLKAEIEPAAVDYSYSVVYHFIEELDFIVLLSSDLKQEIGNINKSTAHRDGRYIGLGLNGINGQLDTAIKLLDKIEEIKNVTLTKLVVTAIESFVRAQKSFLETVSEKYSLRELTQFTDSIQAALKSLKTTVTSLRRAVMSDVVGEEYRTTVRDELKSLEASIESTGDKYSKSGVQYFIGNLDWIGRLSSDLQKKAENITESTAHRDGGYIALGLRGIKGELNTTILALDLNARTIPENDANSVVDALTSFVQNQISLLHTVSDKHSLRTMDRFIPSILEELESLYKSVGSLQDILNKEGLKKAQKQLESWKGSIKSAHDKYSNSLLAATMAHTQTGAKLVDVILDAFEEITQLSDNLRKEIAKVNNFNADQQGSKIALGFGVIIVKVTAASKALAPGAAANPRALSDDDAQLVVDALTTFVQIHQALLNVVIGKHGLIALIPFFEPIRVQLVQLEIIVDKFAFFVIDLIPTQKPKATQEVRDLDMTIRAAVTTYITPFSKSTLAVHAIEGLMDH